MDDRRSVSGVLIEMNGGAVVVKAKYQRTVALSSTEAEYMALKLNDRYHARSKHVDIRHHFIRDHVAGGRVAVRYIPTEQQIADLLTKALGTKRFVFLRDAAGITGNAADTEQ